jgi:adenylate cyclase class 2
MDYEVEQKYRIRDQAALEERLRDLGADFGRPVLQVDHYFGHPARDFASTDEALRIRRVDAKNWVTYKGPKIDQTSKTRQEIELPLPDGDEGAAQFESLLRVLGFRPVIAVRKERRCTSLRWQGRQCEIALDDVEGLGAFVELEFHATEADLEPARQSLESLAGHLGLSDSERRSYLELVLDA